ncbi:MAG: P1 family peptidase [Gammaproteobacteria bacterium]
MQSLKIGHFTNKEKATGLTVFLFNPPGTGAYYISGSSPATRELHTLELDSNVPEINALVLTGGSAFGLGVVDGVMNYLNEQGRGKVMPHGGVVPIVPAAALYDLAIKEASAPTAEDAYEACVNADENNISHGKIGAGTGATVGKLVPNTLRMTGGLGRAQIKLDNGLIVLAYAVVNAVGDIRDQTGKIIAGARETNGDFADCEKFLLTGGDEAYSSPSNTTLVAIFTNAKFSKIELKRIAKMAVAGMGRAISPVFTRYDGDLVFCISLGDHLASELTVGTLAAEATRQAIVNAVEGSVPVNL